MANNYNSNFHDVRNFLLDIPEVMDRRIKRAMEKALEYIGEEVLDLALQYVPKDERDLMRSGRKSAVTWSGQTANITIAFGGTKETEEYAYLVHFDLGRGTGRYGYKTPDAGAGPYFLQRAVDEVATKENIRNKFLQEMRRTK